MPISSPLASLYSVLQNIRTNAETNAALLRKNEAATRAALIDPILRTLGWDTTDIRMVEPEKTINTAWRADYALHNSEGKIELLVEAKCLGSDLEKFSVVQQLLSYAFGFGVQKILITDGLNWHFYSEFNPGNQHYGASFNLLQDDLVVCALHLIQWLDAAHSGHGPFAQNTIQSSYNQQVNPETPRRVETKVVPSLESHKPNNSFVELARVHTLQLQPNQKPTQLRLPDGTVKAIKSWKDVLLECCYFVLRNNLNLTLPILDKAGKTKSLFSFEKPVKVSSTKASYKGETIFIGAHYSAPNCIANALYVLSLAPKSVNKTSAAVSF
ncbi:type I restriction enzyme HsdR N-terminal domain-containing protein [Hymenobacter sp. BT491]|uniref:type I restriction enzyme HsdR N-terminal domain-containing protein n=1 Tax=Hymenobacter sp. BT491 TaxID=2766779 RepID=UPI0016537CBB|nr:type I restriction enzyme HsdR N-terminal domain-containing protein [Hymenobacter sp. BT491]MBC6991337.1 type I restriction enzyme HsdR N-terminal domain-containing protein [Hymenobacter sp. BT491]